MAKTAMAMSSLAESPFLVSEKGEWPSLPRLQPGQQLDLKRVRDQWERIYLPFVFLPTLAFAVVLAIAAFEHPSTLLIVAGGVLFVIFMMWVNWKLFTSFLLGHSIKVGPTQHPQIFNLINEASQMLHIPTPSTFIMQGHGLFEVLVAKFFSRRGMIILTSNLVDDLTEQRSSRELMFFVGRV